CSPHHPQSAQLHRSSFFSSPTRPPPRSPPLSLHDALPISWSRGRATRARPNAAALATSADHGCQGTACRTKVTTANAAQPVASRSEEHTSELQSRGHLVCRLLLEKKKKNKKKQQMSKEQAR